MTLALKKQLLYILFFVNLAIILFFWWQSSSFTLTSSSSIILMSLGRLSGLLLAFFVLMQFMLMGRTRWVEEVFGLDKLSKIHHYNGYFLLTFLILHPLFITLGYAQTSHSNLIQQFLDFFFHYEDVNEAIIAAFLFLIIIGLSIYIVRNRLKYEVWYYVHIFTYLAVALAWGHQLENGQDFVSKPFVVYWYLLYIVVFGNVLLFRFLRPLYMFYKYKFRVYDVIPEALSANCVYITGNNLDKFKIKPGQFLKIRILSKQFWWQDHPFSFSMIPKDNLIRVTVKNSGDFTSQIGTVKKGTPVLIDGPYGAFTLDRAVTKKFLFIAGGVGITPIRSLMEDAGEKGYSVTLLYSNKTANDIILKKEIDQLSKKYGFRVIYVMSEDQTKTFEVGHIDEEKIRRLVKDFKTRDTFICGPGSMMDVISKTLMSMGVKSEQIHFEKFSL